MTSVDQPGVQHRNGYTDTSGGYVNPPQQAYPVQQSYGPGPYQQEQLGRHEYIDKHGQIQRRRRGGLLACCLALCWCCTWPCHGPCCGGL